MSTTLTLENSLKCVREAMQRIKEEYGYNPETNLFGRELPGWVAEVRDSLHAAENHLLNVLDGTATV